MSNQLGNCFPDVISWNTSRPERIDPGGPFSCVSNNTVAMRLLFFFQVTEFNGPMLIDEVECNGTEVEFLECLSVQPGEHDCTHVLSAGVFCSGTYV